MFQAIIIMAIFGFLYALKGGSGRTIFPWWKEFRAKNKYTERLLDGKIISTLGAFLFAVLFNVEIVSLNGGAYGVPEYAVKLLPAALFAVGWLVAVAPSMGEEHDAIGRIKWAGGKYIKWMPEIKTVKMFGKPLFKYREGRMYGIKKGLLRGMWMGGIMCLVTWSPVFIITSFLFVPSVFVGQQLGWMILKKNGWALAEPIIGAFVFGLSVYFGLN